MSDSLRPHGLCSLPSSSTHGMLQAKILEWVAVPFSRGSSQPRDWTQVSWISCKEGRFFTTESQGSLSLFGTSNKCSSSLHHKLVSVDWLDWLSDRQAQQWKFSLREYKRLRLMASHFSQSIGKVLQVTI